MNKKIISYPDDKFKKIFISVENEYNNYKVEYSHITFLINQLHYNIGLLDPNSKDFKNKIARTKLLALSSILENSFYNNELKEKILDLFCKAQKTYFSFNKLLHLYKLKKFNTVVSYDLSLTELNPYNINTFILIENKNKYLFSLHNLISIIENSLSKSSDFFIYPTNPSNPYTKTIFSISTLYNIYFKMKRSNRIISTLFHLFFNKDFNLSSFSKDYEPIIRDFSIKLYVLNTPYISLHESVLIMLKQHYYTKRYSIDDEFPKELLVSIFRPFLYYFYINNYYIKDTEKKVESAYILHYKLTEFYHYNKAFGRKIIKLNKTFDLKKNKLNITKEYTFVTDHISFHNIKLIKNYRYNYSFDNNSEQDNESEPEPNNYSEQDNVSVSEHDNVSVLDNTSDNDSVS